MFRDFTKSETSKRDGTGPKDEVGGTGRPGLMGDESLVRCRISSTGTPSYPLLPRSEYPVDTEIPL